jgi:hypothetical protein
LTVAEVRCRPHTHYIYLPRSRYNCSSPCRPSHAGTTWGAAARALPQMVPDFVEKAGSSLALRLYFFRSPYPIPVSRASNRGISCFGRSMPDMSCTLHLKHRVTPARSLLHWDVTGEPLLGVANSVVHWLRLYVCKRQGHGNACIGISTNRNTAWLVTRLAIEPPAFSRSGVPRHAHLQRGVITLHFLSK